MPMEIVEENITEAEGQGTPVATKFEVEEVDETLNQVTKVAKRVRSTEDPKNRARGNRKVVIIVREQENSDHNQPVFATHPGTGKQYYIPRGTEFIVPYAVYKNLEDCVITKTVADSTGRERVKHIRRYAVELIREL